MMSKAKQIRSFAHLPDGLALRRRSRCDATSIVSGT